MSRLSEILFGKKEKDYAQGLRSQLMQAVSGAGAPGAFGQSADYWRSLLGNNPEDIQAFEAPLRREFQEQTLPGIAEQFAGMGSGALSSSGVRNTALRAGTDLGERLASIRAGLRSGAAQNLSQMGQFGIQSAPFRPATGGLLGGLAQGIGPGLGLAGGLAMGNPLAGLGLGSLFGGQNQSSSLQSPLGNRAGGSGLTAQGLPYNITA